MALGTSYVNTAEAAVKAANKAAGIVVEVAESRPEYATTHYKTFDKYKAVHRGQKSILEGTRVLFTADYVRLLEDALLRDNMHVLSKEQQTHFKKYCIEADSMLSENMAQFDEYLGSYTEEIING